MLFLLQSLLEQGKHIRNIGLAPANVLTLIYPVQGNERALGLNYQNLPQCPGGIKRSDSCLTTL